MFDDTSSAFGLEALSNDELLTCTRRLVGCDNQLLAALLAHLGEVEARGIHRERSCASLYTYCIYELRMSEDSALRRAKAARVVRQFPAVLGAIARGELHLTGLLLLGPHLTEANHVEVMALAKHRTKKEIEKLVRRLDPLPDVPPRIEPLGPAQNGLPNVFTPTWAVLTAALAGPVRELPPGERPSDWTSAPAFPSTFEADSLPPAHSNAMDVESSSPGAHAHGGLPTEANVTLRCRAHNTLAAEEDFGREAILEKQDRAHPRQRGNSDPRQRSNSDPRQRGDSNCEPMLLT